MNRAVIRWSCAFVAILAALAAASEPALGTRPPPRTYLPATYRQFDGSPIASTSRYVTAISDATLRQWGQTAASPGNNRTVVLSIGHPMTPDTVYGYWWTETPITRVETAIQSFITGYLETKAPQGNLQLVIGLTNWGPLTTEVTTTTPITALYQANGHNWGLMVGRLNAAAQASNYGWAVSVAGGIDAEASFNRADHTLAWINGYNSATLYPLFNYGSCDGCPSDATLSTSDAQLTGQGSRRGMAWTWSIADQFAAAWGGGRVHNLPEIYLTSGYNARQWKALKLFGVLKRSQALRFDGLMTQWGACYGTPGNISACQSAGIDNTPSQGWHQLSDRLEEDTRTRLGSALGPPTDISWTAWTAPASAAIARGVRREQDLPGVRLGDGWLSADPPPPPSAQGFVAAEVWQQRTSSATLMIFAGSIAADGDGNGRRGAILTLVYDDAREAFAGDAGSLRVTSEPHGPVHFSGAQSSALVLRDAARSYRLDLATLSLEDIPGGALP